MSSRGLPGSRAVRAGIVLIGLAACLAPVSAAAAAAALTLFVGLCLVAPFFPTWRFFLETHCRGPGDRRQVALTFDDGPDRETLPALLDLLEAERVKATFFLVGERVAAYPEAVERILAGGHTIGNHSWSHDPFLMLRSSERLERELRACQDELGRHGAFPLVFRPPVGITNSRLPSVLRRLGLTCVTFRVRPRDFWNTRLESLATRVLRRTRAGDIVLLHDSSPGAGQLQAWLETVERVVVGLREAGLAIVPLEELLGQPVLRVGSRDASASSSPAPERAERGAAAPSGVGSALSTVLVVGYPALAWLGIRFLGTRTAALLLLAAAAVSHARKLRRRRAELGGLAWLAVTVAGLLLLAAMLDDPRFILAYPALVNLVLLAQFGWTLRSGPPMVERFARLQVDDLSPPEIAYCRTVTAVWCVFFVLNGVTAALVAGWSSQNVWAIYNGFVAYVLMGLLFAVEYVVRKARFGRFGPGLLDRVIERVVGVGPAR
jgi:uncharacterized membrane protein/peptidoglycan/xylan/chitin deacetylase (PgdA/CDA1 family)